jgi:hypothetical protein
MPISDEWTEWHLTPHGWKAGNVKLDGQPTKAVRPPADRVLTYRHQQVISAPYKPLQETVRELWCSRDNGLIEQLLAQYGECPQHLAL